MHGENSLIDIKDKETKIVFKQKYSLHLKGNPATCIEYRFIEFVRKGTEIHSGRYEYRDYAGSNKPVTIVDKVTGESFKQNAAGHLKKEKPLQTMIEKSLKNFDVFKEKAVVKYGDNLYEYINYDWEHRTVTFINILTGLMYTQNIYEHLKGKSKAEQLDDYRTEFVKLAKQAQNNQYEYSGFVGTRYPVTVTNKVTGEVYQQRPKDILKGCLPQKTLCKYTEETYKTACMEKHGERFIVSGYINLNEDVTVVDTKTGKTFKQLASSHLKGCLPKHISCSNTSKAEQEIAKLLEQAYPDCTIVKNFRPKFLKRQELDLFIPELNLAIEYNGITYHHSDENPPTAFLVKTKKPVDYHSKKFQTCLENGIKLIHLFDFEYKESNLLSIVSKYLTHELVFKGSVKRVYKSSTKMLEFYVPHIEFKDTRLATVES